MAIKKINIYEYTDYTSYLKEWFEEEKKSNNVFSFQFFANKAGFKSKGFIANLINGKKALPRRSVFQIASALDLNHRERKYLYASVCLKECENLKEKHEYWEQMQSLRPSIYSRIDKTKFDYFQYWYIAVIREVVTYFDFENDFHKLANYLSPAISAEEAKTAVETLESLEFIKKSDSLYIQNENALYASEDMVSLAVQKYQRRTFELGLRASDRYYDKNNTLKAITLGTNEQGIKAVESLIEEFQERIFKISEQYHEVGKVYQINLQLFPLIKE